MTHDSHPRHGEPTTIVRYVELTFKPEAVDTAMRLLEAQAPLVRGSRGCVHLEINRAMDSPEVFSTYSRWRSPEDLEAYRASEVFLQFWRRVKPHFAEKAVAKSFVHVVPPF